MSELGHTHVSSGVLRSQESIPLKLELQWVWGFVGVLGTKPGFLQEQQVSWITDPFLQPPFISEFYLCCVYVFAWICVFSICMQESKYSSGVWRSKDNLWKPDLSFHQVGPRDQTPLVNLDSKGLHPLSHLSGLLAKLWWLYWYSVLVSFPVAEVKYRQRTLKLKGLPDSQLQVTVRQHSTKL